MTSNLRTPLIVVLACVSAVACGTSSGPTPSTATPPAGTGADGGDGGDAGDGGPAACTPVTPEGYLYRADAIDAFPPCLMDGDKPIEEAVNLGIRLSSS